jgi:hypothetical protein
VGQVQAVRTLLDRDTEIRRERREKRREEKRREKEREKEEERKRKRERETQKGPALHQAQQRPKIPTGFSTQAQGEQASLWVFKAKGTSMTPEVSSEDTELMGRGAVDVQIQVQVIKLGVLWAVQAGL